MKRLLFLLLVLGVCFIGTNAFGEGNDEYTVLLLHCNGNQGSQVFIDDSFAGHHTVTANGNAQVDTAQSIFGGASALFDGAGDYLSVPDSEDWNFGTGDFTIDFWIRFTSSSGVQFFVGQDETAIRYWRFFKNDDKIQIEAGYDGYGNQGRYVTGDLTWEIERWYHIAGVRSGSNAYIFRDGESLPVTESIAFGTLPNLATEPLIIGSQFGSTQFFNGWVDEFRISKGIARWTSNFTPPIEEYNTIPNEPPVAEAGNDVVAEVGEPVTLDGSQSYDPDGQIISWEWRSLSDVEKPIVAEGEIATMNAHGYAGELIELTVTDNRGGQAKDTMKIINPVINDISTMQNQISDLQLENQQQDEQITVLQQENQQQQSQITGLDQQLQDLQALVDQIATFPPIERYLRGKDDSGL